MPTDGECLLLAMTRRRSLLRDTPALPPRPDIQMPMSVSPAPVLHLRVEDFRSGPALRLFLCQGWGHTNHNVSLSLCCIVSLRGLAP